MKYTTEGYDKDSLRTHFATAVESRVFPSPTEIEYCVYSHGIWERFRSLVAKHDRIIDLGCGGGTALYVLEHLGYKDLFGLDFVSSAPTGFLCHTTFVEGDILHAPFDNGSFDAVISTQVIEHVDDTRFVAEVRRLLKNGGVALLTSVLKGPKAWYFYKNAEGERVLEPSHLREYRSSSQFANLFADSFEIVDLQTPRMRFPIIDPVFRALYAVTRQPWFREAPTRNALLKTLRHIRVPIPSYSAIEILLRKKS